MLIFMSPPQALTLGYKIDILKAIHCHRESVKHAQVPTFYFFPINWNGPFKYRNQQT